MSARKLSDYDVQHIRFLAKSGRSQYRLSIDFDVSKFSIARILRGEMYRDVPHISGKPTPRIEFDQPPTRYRGKGRPGIDFPEVPDTRPRCCGRLLEPGVDRMGNSVDECRQCRKQFVIARRSA